MTLANEVRKVVKLINEDVQDVLSKHGWSPGFKPGTYTHKSLIGHTMEVGHFGHVFHNRPGALRVTPIAHHELTDYLQKLHGEIK